MTVLGIDPGSTESAYVLWDGNRIVLFGDLPNEKILARLADEWSYGWTGERIQLVIEQIRGYGITAGNETFDTCWWSGRFFEGCRGAAAMLPRKTIATHLCGHARPGDKFIRQALMDRLGAPGTKRQPGPTYGVTGHAWSALAVAVTWWDLHQPAPPPDATEAQVTMGEVA